MDGGLYEHPEPPLQTLYSDTVNTDTLMNNQTLWDIQQFFLLIVKKPLSSYHT